MYPGALRALEFDRIVAAVVAHAQTPMGGARLADLEPASDPRSVTHALGVALSDLFRARGGELQATVGGATELDVLQAKAQFSIRVEVSARLIPTGETGGATIVELKE